MKKIMIFLGNGKEVITWIPKCYIDDDLVLYWIDCVCKEPVEGWIDYKLL